MKRRIVFILLLAAGTAWSIGLGVGGFGGVAFPTGAMADEDDSGNDDWDGSELGSSPALGAKVILGIIPLLELEAAFAYHTGHASDVFADAPEIDEATAKITPITFGANVKYRAGLIGVYGGGGLGYYFGNFKASGTMESIVGEIPIEGETTVDAMGVYLSGGIRFYIGALAVDLNPRYHVIMNDGDHDVTVSAEYEGFHWSETETLKKTFNDTYVDIRVGVDYYFL